MASVKKTGHLVVCDEARDRCSAASQIAAMVGDVFQNADVLYEIETEKVTQEIAAPGSGRLVEILVPEGENAKVNGAVCIVEVSA